MWLYLLQTLELAIFYVPSSLRGVTEPSGSMLYSGEYFMGLIVVSSTGKGVRKCVLLGSGKSRAFFTCFVNLQFYAWWSALERS